MVALENKPETRGLSRAQEQTKGLSEHVCRNDAAQRALNEAELRREVAHALSTHPDEHGGRGGLEPTRYGDWEVSGVASDF